MATPPWTAFDGAKLHSGAAKVLGVTVGGQAGTVAVTIENDGVILYDASRKVRLDRFRRFLLCMGTYERFRQRLRVSACATLKCRQRRRATGALPR